MSQRVSGYERAERDFYPTPEWVTRALIAHLPERVKSVWEPAAGDGRMAAALHEAGYRVWATDIAPQQPGAHLVNEADFFAPPAGRFSAEAIITNPPYGPGGRMAQKFIGHALQRMRPACGVVAMLLSVDFDSGRTRQWLFGDCPAFATKLVLMERIVWFDGGKHGPSKNHAWFIWDWAHDGPPEIAYGPLVAQAQLEV